MGILDKFMPQPRWKHADPAIRLEGVRELDDALELQVLAESDPDAKVRRAALGKVADSAVLGRIASGDADAAVREEATEQLLALAMDGRDAAAALSAATQISDARRLAQLAKSGATEATDAVRESAISRLSDERLLGAVARHAKVEAIAAAAATRLTSADELLDTVLNCDHKDVALAAFDRVIDASAPDQTLLKTIEARSQQKAVSKRARTILQAIEDAETARKAAEEEKRRQENIFCEAVEHLIVTDADRAETDLARFETGWSAITNPDATAAARFAAGAGAVRDRIASIRREAQEAAELARQRAEAIATREALCQRVETIDGEDILEQLRPIEEEWSSLGPLCGNGPEADRLSARFASAVTSSRKRAEIGRAHV